MDIKMTPQEIKKIVSDAPKGWQWVVISNQGKMVYFKCGILGLVYHIEGTCWVSANPDVKKYLVSKDCLLSRIN